MSSFKSLFSRWFLSSTPKAPAQAQAHAPMHPAVAPLAPSDGGALSQVKSVIAVASGKGGVGKSTVTTNLALALKYYGAEVGLLDADIYGPSQTALMGAAGNRVTASQPGGLLTPVRKNGVRMMSLPFVAPSEGPVVWRAPIANKMLSQFLNGTEWGALDALLIDLPPGTGDIQLTLAQHARISGAIIVTTPQDIALGIAQKGLKMFQQVNVPILGIVENMSGYECEKCGHENHPFKQGGGKKLAETLGVPFLGSIPLDSELMEASERGEPILLNKSDSKAARAFLALGQAVMARVSQEAQKEAQFSANAPSAFQVGPDGELQLEWKNEKGNLKTGGLAAYTLRANCRCANCVDENTGKRLLDPTTVPLDIRVTSVGQVGRYALTCQFSDGHSTGIYSFTRLKELFDAAEKAEVSFTV